MSESREAISLWQETLEALAEHGKTWDDVLFVGIGREKQMLRSVFEGLAKALFYRPWCYGGNLIDTNLSALWRGLHLDSTGIRRFRVVGVLPHEAEPRRRDRQRFGRNKGQILEGA